MEDPERRDASWKPAFSVVPPAELAAPPVVLRRYWGDELPALLGAVSDSLENLRPWLRFASADPLEPSLAEFISRSAEQFQRAENFNYYVWDEASSSLVGSTGLNPRSGPGRIEVGYWIRTGWHRRGLATACAAALTTAAFDLEGIAEVHIRCDEANVASAAVPRRLGFTLVRVVGEEIVAPGQSGRFMEWVITRHEWSEQTRRG